ncbi:unnamed protein product, partial [Aureobasidium mustum]
MAVRPITRSPLLLLTISICLALPILAVSTHILSIYRSEHASNPWWLPVWHAHFDTKGLIAVIAGSCVVFALDLISVGLVIAGNKTSGKIIKWTTAMFMAAATIAALVALIIPAVANAAAPSKSDTVQTWTCRWKGAVGAPDNFGPLCRESPQTLDEELVIITKSVEVATTGSNESPRIR